MSPLPWLVKKGVTSNDNNDTKPDVVNDAFKD